MESVSIMVIVTVCCAVVYVWQSHDVRFVPWCVREPSLFVGA